MIKLQCLEASSLELVHKYRRARRLVPHPSPIPRPSQHTKAFKAEKEQRQPQAPSGRSVSPAPAQPAPPRSQSVRFNPGELEKTLTAYEDDARLPAPPKVWPPCARCA
jgi:hypothetical protein